jgi:hypothetical protein
MNFQLSPTTQQVADLKARLHYLNVHSSNFPTGEIRGQLRWNPTLEESFFVRQQYIDFLGREPDPRRGQECATPAQLWHAQALEQSQVEGTHEQGSGRVARAAWCQEADAKEPWEERVMDSFSLAILVGTALLVAGSLIRRRARGNVERRHQELLHRRDSGRVGWVLLWLLGVPIPLLLVFYLLRGCT